MLYPASIEVDFYVQAESIEEARRKLFKAFWNDALELQNLDPVKYPEIVLDDAKISNPVVLNKQILEI